MPYKSERERACYLRHRDKHLARNKRKRDERRQKVFELLGGCCCLCRSLDDLEIDHINPLYKRSRQSILSQGLSTTMKEIDNLQLLCKSCHKQRSDAQRKAAFKAFFSLPLDEQNKLIQEQIDA